MERLSPDQIDQFVNDGYVKVEAAFSSDLADQCRAILWKASQCEPHDPSTWKHPVVRIGEIALEPFVNAANTTLLHTAFDQLVGPGNWLPRMSLGSFPIRFPHHEQPNDTGWHVDASFPGDDPSDFMGWRINIRSRGRALLMLFLFSDVGENDAPTKIRIGSHLDVAKILEAEGEKGLSFMELAQKLDATCHRPEALATGVPGTVYLCHPFIVHAAQPHCGSRPKFMAQPPLFTKREFDLERVDENSSPVEKAIWKGLGCEDKEVRSKDRE